MHIPDGLLDLKTASTTATFSVLALSGATSRLRRGLSRRRIPMMGLSAAFLFAAQMLNFPVAGGTSGHLLGGVLAAVLLGPSAAIVAMTAVLLVQCLLFADGGLLALGANVFNMAVVSVLGGHLVFRAIRSALKDRRGLLVATAFASWLSTVLASVSCALELAWSGVAPWGVVFPVMAGIHMVIGLGEALITTLVIAAIARTRSDLLEDVLPAGAPPPSRFAAAWGTVCLLALMLFAVPFASSWPDGLERALKVVGFHTRPSAPPLVPPLADYRLPGIPFPAAATWAAGFLGTLVVFGLSLALGRALAPKPGERKTAGTEA